MTLMMTEKMWRSDDICICISNVLYCLVLRMTLESMLAEIMPHYALQMASQRLEV